MRLSTSLLCLLTLYSSLMHELMAADSQTTHITPAELAALIEAGQSPTVIDVRSGWEYRAGHVPGAIHVPFWLAYSRVDEIKAAKDRTVVVYCEHGPRAGVGKHALTREGFTRVRYLEGHMRGWRKAGLPTEKGPD